MKTGRFKGSYLSYVLIYFFSYFAMSAFSAVLSVYLTGIGKSASEMSLIVSSAGLFSLFVLPVTGYLCDLLRRSRPISIALLLGMGLLALLFPLTGRVWALFLINGLAMSLYNSTMPISERIAAACKYRYGALRVWGTFGYAAGAQAAGIAIQNFPPMALFVMVFLTALLAALGYLGAEEPAHGAREDPVGKPAGISPASFLRNRQFLLFLLISLLFYGCSGANMTYAPILLNSLGVSTGVVGTVLSVSTLVEIPIILFSNKFMDRFSGKFLFAATCVIMLAQFLVYGFAGSAPPVIAAMVLLKAVASTMYMMLVLKLVSNLVEPALATTGLAIANTVGNLGSILMQNLGGLIVDASSVQWLYLVMSGLVVVSLVLALFLKVENREKVFS